MRVVHVLPTTELEYGGPVVVAQEITAELSRQSVTAVIWSIDVMPRAGLRLVGAWGAKRREFDHILRGTDLVHIHGLWNPSGTLAARMCRKSSIPYVVTPHGMLDRWALRRSRLKKLVFSWLFERATISEASGLQFFNVEEWREARDYGLIAPAFILPNGVRTDRYFTESRRAWLESLHPGCKSKTIALFLGRLHEKKGLDLLLPALAGANSKGANIHLFIAGPETGRYEQVVRSMVETLGVSSDVTLLGMIRGEEKAAVLSAADFFVLTSHQEGDSVAVKEAMASGLPVVVTPACHFPEIDEADAGIVVSPRMERVMEALQRMTVPHRRKAMGRNARQLIVARYEWPGIVRRLINVYRDVRAGDRTASEWV